MFGLPEHAVAREVEEVRAIGEGSHEALEGGVLDERDDIDRHARDGHLRQGRLDDRSLPRQVELGEARRVRRGDDHPESLWVEPAEAAVLLRQGRVTDHRDVRVEHEELALMPGSPRCRWR